MNGEKENTNAVNMFFFNILQTIHVEIYTEILAGAYIQPARS